MLLTSTKNPVVQSAKALLTAKGRRRAEKTIRRFLHRHYSADGHGGLFWIPGCPLDLRKIEIWYQLCHYLSGRYGG